MALVIGSPRATAAHFVIIALGASLSSSACLPREDLADYSGSAAATFTGEASSDGQGGASSGGAPAGAAGSGAQAEEGLGGALSLDPSASAGASIGGGAGASLAGGSVGPRAAPGELDAGTCDGDGEFPSVDGERCYRVNDDVASWTDARSECLDWGGDLASIESAEEDAFLTERLTISVWIGANDREVEGTMRWADGGALSFANWGDGQPDDFSAQEDCVEKRIIAGGTWNDRPCEADVREFVCER